MNKEKIAIVGGGISGLVTANLLCNSHDITLYEANDYIGGHTHTVDIKLPEGDFAVDTGFIVCNDRTYPNFLRLLQLLGVEIQPSNMSFGVKNHQTGIEYRASNINTLFAQRKNLFRPLFYSMIRDIFRFKRESQAFIQTGDRTILMKDFLMQKNYSPWFVSHFIVPMGAAIWSSGTDDILQFPAVFFVEFFHNHGVLHIQNQPQWYVIKRGSREYLKKLIQPFRENINLNSPVQSIVRSDKGVKIKTAERNVESFDHVIIATHSDQALNMLVSPSENEKQILSDIPYKKNTVILHQDKKILPLRKRAWASWNYAMTDQSEGLATLTYNMNLLQTISSNEPLLVTLNQDEIINQEKILQRFIYHHPLFTLPGINAKKNWRQINGKNRTHFCGAYWGNGFHEDGVNSALLVAKDFKKTVEDISG